MMDTHDGGQSGLPHEALFLGHVRATKLDKLLPDTGNRRPVRFQMKNPI
ncbi:hypothetical protein GCM10009000_079270 [Halobacterium noricense]|uniref:Transposase n=1 Tax=Haladaptatus pallidirubidus TaxID=1008152 RepID=A0AAV3UNC2_9EURY